MMINRDNYESYLVDYAEGTLASQLIHDMELFLQANPDIRDELELFLEDNLKSTTISFPEKASLKEIPFSKTEVNSEYFQQQCIAYIEGLMSESEGEMFLKSVNAKQAKQEAFKLFQSTVLIPESILFSEKLLLKRFNSNQAIDNETFEWYCIAYMENWLDETSNLAFNNFLSQHPEKMKDFIRYQNTRLVPDFSISYPSKKHLKKYIIFSARAKKYLAYASSTAAILVFGAMLFYSTQLNNKVQLTGSLAKSNNLNPNNNEQKHNPMDEVAAINSFDYIQKNENLLRNENPVHNKKRNKDFEHFNQSKELIPMNPIRISGLECPPCKQIFSEGKDIQYSENNFAENPSILEDGSSKYEVLVKNETLNSKLWNITQVGISEISKLTKTEIIIKNEEENQKTKIAFNSRFFAFSTSVKSKQIN